MSDTFTLDGLALDLVATDALLRRFNERLGTIPSLTIQRRGIALPPESDDPWMGKPLTWEHNGTLRFSGTIRSRTPHRAEIGWVVDYQALGLRDRMDRLPHTDATSGLDTSAYNAQPEDLSAYQLDRAGRTVGQILTDVLTSNANANALNAQGIGNYTGLPDTPALPAATVADLAAFSIIPPRPVYVSGEKIGGAIDGLLESWAPNVRMRVEPDGTLRFLDLRTFTAQTLTMGVDPIEPTEISRDLGDCFQSVCVRGAPIARMFLFKLSQGTLLEDFGYSSLTSDQAKAGWDPNDFTGTTSTQDVGTCTCSSTTTIEVTSSNAAETWAADAWDQTATGQKGVINLYWSAGAGLEMMWTARIVACTALTAGGTSTVTLDSPLPHTNFDHYTITGMTQGASLVYRRYKIADSTLWPLVVPQSTYPQAFVNASGAASVTSTPMGAVLWPQGTSGPPYSMFAAMFVWDASTGHVTFDAPTYITANDQAPADVWVMLPVNTGPNVVYSPQRPGGTPVYSGDSHTIEGLTDTLTVTMADWRDPGQLVQVQAYADDLLDTVNNGVREGQVTYYGMIEAALDFGLALNIAGTQDDGSPDTTGWESANLPVIEVEVEWSQGASDYVTTLTASNRRAHYTAEMFMRPERSYQALGLSEGSDVQMLGGATIDAGVTNLGAPQIPAGYGGGGDLGIPTSFEDLGIPTSMGQLGIPTSMDDLGLPSMADFGLDADSFRGPANNFGSSGNNVSRSPRKDSD